MKKSEQTLRHEELVARARQAIDVTKQAYASDSDQAESPAYFEFGSKGLFRSRPRTQLAKDRARRNSVKVDYGGNRVHATTLRQHGPHTVETQATVRRAHEFGDRNYAHTVTKLYDAEGKLVHRLDDDDPIRAHYVGMIAAQGVEKDGRAAIAEIRHSTESEAE